MIDIPCVIFAGGKSSRMGEDKTLLPFGDFKTLTEYQLNKLTKIFSKVYISCKNSNKFDFDANFIEDNPDNNTYAPSSGFLAMFEKLDYESFFVLSVDSPFITKDTIDQIINLDKTTNDATVAKTLSGIQGMCGIYHRSIEEKMHQCYKKDNHKISYLLQNCQTTYVYFEDEEEFLNLNKPSEYQQALSLI